MNDENNKTPADSPAMMGTDVSAAARSTANNAKGGLGPHVVSGDGSLTAALGGWLAQTAIRVAVLLAVGSVFRVYFAFQNPALVKGNAAADLLGAALVGMRFDLASAFAYNGVLFLIGLWLTVWNASRLVQKIWSGLFVAVNFVLLAFSFVDAELFNLQGRHLAVFSVEFAPEYFRNPLSLVATHGLKALVLVALVAGMVAVERVLAARETQWPRRGGLARVGHSVLLTFIVAAVSVVSIRGGLQAKPIGVMTAGNAGSDGLAKLALSSTYMLTKWRPSQHLKRETFFDSEADLFAALEPDSNEGPELGVLTGDNVVVIVMESFAREYMGWKNPWPGHTPFLDQLAEKSLSFSNGFANGVRSIEFPPALFAGIPNYMSESYINSVYAPNPVRSVTQAFRDRGYQTAFFHGVGNGTMHFDSFMKLIGFEKYYGLNEYTGSKSEDFDGTWGIFDGPYFKYFLEHLNQAKEPFFYSVFSATSHHPYALPAGFETRYQAGEHPIHKVIAYSDDMLREFFAEASKQHWFKRTLFVITGDHTSANTRPEYMNELARFQVPIIFYHPGRALPDADRGRLVQHADLPATLLDLYGIEDVYSPFSRSVFRGKDPVVVNPFYDKYWIADMTHVLMLYSDSSTALFDRVNDPFLKAPLTDQPEVKARLEQRLKAHLQVYRNGMIDSSLFSWQRSWPGKGIRTNTRQ